MLLAVALVACGGDPPEPIPQCTRVTRYVDADGDGFGTDRIGLCAELASPGLSDLAGDCDDTDPNVSPAAEETCAPRDEDCDGIVDEGVGTEFTLDADGDGYAGAGGETRTACHAPAGFARWADDCDDGDDAIGPGAIERCNAIDDDCNGVVDDSAAFACQIGDVVPCTTTCRSTGTGMCADCAIPAPESCDPPPESCTGVDDDCDRRIDEGVRTARAIVHTGMDGAVQIESIANGGSWTIVARLSDGGIVAQVVFADGSLGPPIVVVDGTDASRANNRRFCVALDAWSEIIAWTDRTTTGVSLYGVRRLVTGDFTAPVRIGWVETYSGAFSDCDDALVLSGLVVYALGGNARLATSSTTLASYHASTGYPGSTTNHTTLVRRSETTAFMAWTSSGGIHLTEVYVDLARGYAATGNVADFTTSLGAANGYPVLAYSNWYGAENLMLAWWTGAGSAAVQALTFHPPTGLRGYFTPTTAPAVITGATANTHCALGLATSPLDASFVMSYENGTTESSAVDALPLSRIGDVFLAEPIDAAPTANGCAVLAPGPGSSILQTVLRDPSPVSSCGAAEAFDRRPREPSRILGSGHRGVRDGLGMRSRHGSGRRMSSRVDRVWPDLLFRPGPRSASLRSLRQRLPGNDDVRGRRVRLSRRADVVRRRVRRDRNRAALCELRRHVRCGSAIVCGGGVRLVRHERWTVLRARRLREGRPGVRPGRNLRRVRARWRALL